MKGLRALCVAVLLFPSLAFAADDPLAGVRERMLSGCYDEVRDQLVKACHAFRERSDASGEASAWLLTGVTDSSTGDTNSARIELEEAAEKFIAVDDPFAAWLSLTALAQIERQQDRLEASIAVQERGLALLRRAADPESRFSLATMKVLGPVFGVPPEMLGQLEAYPELVKPILLRFTGVLARDTYGATLVEAGELEKAEKQLLQASEEAAMFGGLLDAEIATHVGDLRQRQWRLDEARDSYLKALKGGPSVRAMSFGDPIRELSIIQRLAELDLFSGRVDEALAWNDRALALVRETGQSKREAGVIEKRADLLQKAGRYDDAVVLYEQLLKLATANADLYLEASIECNLGSLHMLQGTYGTSAKHLERAIELYQKLNEPYLEAPAWILLAEVDMQVDMQAGATNALDHARTLAKKSGFKLAGSMVELLIAANKVMAGQGSLSDFDELTKAFLDLPDAKEPYWHDLITVLPTMLRIGLGLPASFEQQHGTGEPLQAVSVLLEGKVLFDRGDHEGARAAWMRATKTVSYNDIRAGLFGLIGASYWSDGKRAEGIRYFTKVASTLEVSIEDVKVEEMLAGYLGSSRHLYFDLLVDMLTQEGRWNEAFAQAERARARAFLQMVGNHRFNAEQGADPRLVREAEILRNEIAARERHPDKAQAGSIARARARYATLLTRVKVSNPEYASLTNVEPLRLDDVRNDVAPDTTLIAYFVSARAVHAWVVDRSEAHYVRLPIDQEGLRRIVCWAGSLASPAARGVRTLGECGDAASADDAFDQLIAPIQGWIRQRKLILIPHGVLHYVPFAALHNRAADRYLIDDFTLTYAPSASALRFLRAKESPVNGSALVLGDPTTMMSRLPGAAQEATAVARILGTTPYLGADAREALLYELHGKTDLVHLAAHGVYDPVNPLFSRIALASGGAHDGNLTVRDILSSVDLTGVNLVVLSACQSAVGARSGGDEVVGLTRALLYAGTPGVISTLWNIDDAASAGLMEDFYRRLAAGASVADALRHSQLSVKERYPDPKYWAAFTLNGDPQGRWKHAEH